MTSQHIFNHSRLRALLSLPLSSRNSDSPVFNYIICFGSPYKIRIGLRKWLGSRLKNQRVTAWISLIWELTVKERKKLFKISSITFLFKKLQINLFVGNPKGKKQLILQGKNSRYGVSACPLWDSNLRRISLDQGYSLGAILCLGLSFRAQLGGLSQIGAVFRLLGSIESWYPQ